MSIRLLFDENFNGTIVKGLRRRAANIDAVRAQDVGLTGQTDLQLLAWAAQEARVVVTHDADTLIDEAHQRLRAGHPMPGVLIVKRTIAFSTAIDDLILVIEVGLPEDLANRVIFIPL